MKDKALQAPAIVLGLLGLIILGQGISLVSFWSSLDAAEPISIPPRAGAGAEGGGEEASEAQQYATIVERGLFGKAPTSSGRSSARPSAKLWLTGVMGDRVILYSETTKKTEFVSVGESFEGAKLTEIGAQSVKIERDGKVEELKIFSGEKRPSAFTSSPSRPSSSKSSPSKSPPKPPTPKASPKPAVRTISAPRQMPTFRTIQDLPPEIREKYIRARGATSIRIEKK